MRIEVLGCYEPYSRIVELPTTPLPKINCSLCPGAPEPKHCICTSNEWWDGEQCTSKQQCPCYVEFISYSVGTTYENENCDQCTCSLYGVAKCKPVKCPPCSRGLISKRNDACACECKPCLETERICPSTNMCLKKNLWCDGVIDCVDDEIDCVKPTTPSPVVEPSSCPPVECPPGFNANITKSEVKEVVTEAPSWSPFGSSSKWSSYFKKSRAGSGSYGVKTRKGSYDFKKHAYRPPPPPPAKIQQCPLYECIPVKGTIVVEKCPPKPKCLLGYELQTATGKTNACNTYSCVQLKVKLPDAKCNVTGRTFTTFDGTEFKYDICDHILARDKENQFWEVREMSDCKYIGPCTKYLIIKQLNDTIKIRTDLSVEFNNYNYTVPQLQKIGAQLQQFAIKQVSDTYILYSSIYELSIIWDTLGNTKIIVPGTARGKLEGMCGYFDGTVANDKMKPDGTLAKTSAEFGDSWGESAKCEVRVCPVHIQQEAYKACNVLREEPLSKCGGVLSLDKLISQCVETVCACSENNSTKCHCGALLHAVTECHSFDPSIDLSGWRIQNDCPVDCPDGLVYKECFKRVCEPCCSELMVPDACPVTEECFPGCYCPEGFVRDGDRCVKPSDCRDCVCEGYDLSRYVSFDKQDYRFNGNCTYVLAQTMKNVKGPSFKIYGTNGLCDDGSGEICLQSATILIKDHIVHIGYNKEKKLRVWLDDKQLDSLSLKSDWVNVHETAGRSVLVCLVKLELDLEFFVKGKGFALRIPSHFFYDKTEGLCGNCNLNIVDDLKTSDGIIATDVDVFGTSWRVDELPGVIGKSEEMCQVGEKLQECVLPHPGLDPCLKLYEVDIFGRCHAVVDVNVYVENCHHALCKEEVSACQFIESYVRECQAEGICLDWRSKDYCPYYCPKGLDYKYCTLGCTLTCDNYKLYDNDPSACKTPPRESCVCPNGQVVKDGICINSTRCEPCDQEGHYPGDKWHPDPCTECTCSVGAGVQCQRDQCPASPLCTKGYKLTLIKATELDCCPQHVCVPEPTEGPQCPDPQQPVCGYGQVMQLETTPAGCQQFTCRCKAADECEDTTKEMNLPREAGMVAELDTSGCCPRVVVSCKKSTCRPPPDCPPFHEPIVVVAKSCCKEYKCEIPDGKCLYEMAFEEDLNGGEKPRIKQEMLLKDVGDKWNDGPCRNCECKEGNSKALCSKKVCGLMPSSENYIYEPKFVNHKCCPIYVRTACKIDGKVYQAGDTWADPKDPCKSYTCSSGSAGEINIVEAVQTCKTNCPLGWEYKESINNDQCCGECKQTGCVVMGKVYPNAATWTSIDKCTNYTCFYDNNQMQVVTFPSQCPDISSCPKESIVNDGCCKKCEIPEIRTENQVQCGAESLALNETVKIVRQSTEEHGICFNKDPIKGFTECRGACSSYTIYNQESGDHDNKCECCTGIKFSTISVKMDCEDGQVFDKIITVPVECTCHPQKCSQPSKPQRIQAKRPQTSYF